MPLESLNNEQINIHDLTIEEEKKPMQEWQKHYEELKESPFYDKKNELWNTAIDKNQKLQNPHYRSIDQLVGVLVEAQLDEKSAFDFYTKLKSIPLYDSARKQWNNSLAREMDIPVNDNRLAREQLFGILVELQFDDSAAHESYEKLRKNHLFDEKKGLWYVSIKSNQNLANNGYNASDQILDILIESKSNKQSAQKRYDELKKTNFYDWENKQWNLMLGNPEIMSSNRYAFDQLLGVLLESQFNKGSARESFQNLKKTLLFDEKNNQWYRALNQDQSLSSPDILAKDQLLAILCEKELEETKNDIIDQTPPLPEERNY